MKGTDCRFGTLNTRVLNYGSQGGMQMTRQAAMTLAVPAPMPMPVGSIDAYIQAVNRFPILSVEEEQRLARRFRDENDLEAARQLVKVATTKAQRKLFFNLRSMKKDLGPMSMGEVANVANELHVKPEEVLEMETRLAGQELAFEGERDDEDSFAPAQYIADEAAEPYRVLEAEESERVKSAGLEKALATLDPRSRRIVEARWLREKDAATLHDLAAEFKVSAERIRQIEAKALDKMRKALPAPA